MRERLSYSNVVSTLALFMVLTGGAAYAASKIGKADLKRHAVESKKIAPQAVKNGKLAEDAVRRYQLADGSVGNEQLADGSVGSEQLADGSVGGDQLASESVRSEQLAAGAVDNRRVKDGSIDPTKLKLDIAAPTGGSQAVSSGPDPYTLSKDEWIQREGHVNVVFGAATAMLAYDNSGAGSCQVYFELRVNDHPVGGGQLQTSSTSPERVAGSLGAQPELGTDASEQRRLTALVASNGACAAGSTIESSHFEVIDFG